MDRATFWKIVEETRPGNNDPDRHCARLVARLKKLPPEEIVAFERAFGELSGEAYRADRRALGEIEVFCSDDAFMDFRAWLVMQGQDVFETVLESPEYLGEITVRDCVMEHEGYNYVAMTAYEAKTGEDEIPDVGPTGPARLKGRAPRTAKRFQRKFPMLYRLLKDPPQIDPGWLKWQGGTVKQLAQAIAKDRRWADLPVLADTLEEAGCGDPFLLDHLRARRRHARSCWVTNFLLGKR